MRPANADVHCQDACHDSPLHERPAHGGQQALRHNLQVHGEAPRKFEEGGGIITHPGSGVDLCGQLQVDVALLEGSGVLLQATQAAMVSMQLCSHA